MKPEQLEILKKKLEEKGLNSEQWEDWLSQASETCSCLAEVLRETEPYATGDISALIEATDILVNFSEE